MGSFYRRTTIKVNPKTIWNNIINSGIEESHFRFQITLRRIFNFVILVMFLIMVTVAIEDFITNDSQGLLIITCFIVFIVFIFWLSRIGKFEVATFTFNFSIPIGLLILSILYPDSEILLMSFLVLIFTSLLFTKSNSEKFILVSLNVCLYYVCSYIDLNIEPLMQNRVLDGVSKLSIFVCCAVGLGSMTYFLLKELTKNEVEIDALVNSLQTQNKQLEKSNQELEKLTYLASHDLKAPVRTIISFLGLAERKLASNDFEGMKEYLQIVKDGAHQMNLLITDTLNFSTIDQDKKVPDQQLYLTKIVQTIETNLTALYQNFEIQYNNLPYIKTNEGMLYKLFQNIIENGLKYNDKDHKIIKISHTYENSNLHIIIEDNGIGIDSLYHEEIFEMYKRLHSQAVFQGNGLGLAICKKICVELGGDITVESVINEGSKFIIKLPLEPIIESKVIVSDPDLLINKIPQLI